MVAAGEGQPPARVDFDRQIALLQRFVALCRRHGIALTVAMSPLAPAVMAGQNRDELARVVERINRVVALWDFTFAGAIAERRELWLDASHFSHSVGRMMLERIFGADPVPDSYGFGRRLAPRNPQ
ncbi:MAG: hypothetical protein HY056_06205 [Proteobacteria bacterium]|nr:hypothetical protein [Pseudomonadota bacterium]